MPPQLTGDEALAVPVIAVGLCQLLFGNRAALGRCKKQHAPFRSLCKALFVTDGTKVIMASLARRSLRQT
jgi:hypothetical protein